MLRAKQKKNTKAQKNSRQLKTQQIKEGCSCAGEVLVICSSQYLTGRYNYDVKCKESEWTAKPHCKDVDLPQKEKFEVTGRGGSPVYAWANVREATYINKDVQFLEPEVFYCKRDDEGATKHRFSVKFNNLKTDGMRFECTLKSISRCEIYFNGFKVGSMTQSYCSFAELLPRSEFLLITHKFTFDHGSTHWGQYESFLLNLSYGPLPKHVTAEIRANIHPKTQRINNFGYRQISCQGMSSIEFLNIDFRETCMHPTGRRSHEVYGGDHLYSTAFKAVMEKREWRALSRVELEKAWSESIEGAKINKIKYWKCRYGKRACHGGDHRLQSTFVSIFSRGKPEGTICSLECAKVWRDNIDLFLDYSVKHPLCLARIKSCNDGLLWCSLCRMHNVVQHEPRWRCKVCNRSFSTFEQCVQHENDH